MTDLITIDQLNEMVAEERGARARASRATVYTEWLEQLPPGSAMQFDVSLAKTDKIDHIRTGIMTSAKNIGRRIFTRTLTGDDGEKELWIGALEPTTPEPEVAEEVAPVPASPWPHQS